MARLSRGNSSTDSHFYVIQVLTSKAQADPRVPSRHSHLPIDTTTLLYPYLSLSLCLWPCVMLRPFKGVADPVLLFSLPRPSVLLQDLIFSLESSFVLLLI